MARPATRMTVTSVLRPKAEVEASAFAAAALLGGPTALRRSVQTEFDVHDAIMDGLPGGALAHMLDHVEVLPTEDVLKAIGVSARTVQRRSHRPRKALSPEQSGRTWKFAELLAKATEVFGGQAEAEAWLGAPAYGLGERRPIDLLATPVGAGIVEQLLGRIEHGIYS